MSSRNDGTRTAAGANGSTAADRSSFFAAFAFFGAAPGNGRCGSVMLALRKNGFFASAAAWRHRATSRPNAPGFLPDPSRARSQGNFARGAMWAVLFTAAVWYPAFASTSTSVGTSALTGWNPSAPLRCGTRPVMNADRDGWQIGAVTWWLTNRW